MLDFKTVLQSTEQCSQTNFPILKNVTLQGNRKKKNNDRPQTKAGMDDTTKTLFYFILFHYLIFFLLKIRIKMQMKDNITNTN